MSRYSLALGCLTISIAYLFLARPTGIDFPASELGQRLVHSSRVASVFFDSVSKESLNSMSLAYNRVATMVSYAANGTRDTDTLEAYQLDHLSRQLKAVSNVTQLSKILQEAQIAPRNLDTAGKQLEAAARDTEVRTELALVIHALLSASRLQCEALRDDLLTHSRMISAAIETANQPGCDVVAPVEQIYRADDGFPPAQSRTDPSYGPVGVILAWVRRWAHFRTDHGDASVSLSDLLQISRASSALQSHMLHRAILNILQLERELEASVCRAYHRNCVPIRLATGTQPNSTAWYNDVVMDAISRQDHLPRLTECQTESVHWIHARELICASVSSLPAAEQCQTFSGQKGDCRLTAGEMRAGVQSLDSPVLKDVR